ncbi:MAG: AAA family ATPase [Candidatus Methanoperedens sp.]|nr:AAA family ATPase [Candidatus Methanoperedens sp.]
MHLLEDENQIAEAQKAFQDTLTKTGAKQYKCKIGYQGGSEQADVFWLESLGVWVSFQKYENRYWNPFGIDRPVDDGLIGETCEINFPLKGINKQISGAFAEDKDGSIYIMHNGRIGGGKKGIGKSLFMENYTHGLIESIDGVKYVKIGKLGDPSLPSNIANFVKEIQRIKSSSPKIDSLPKIVVNPKEETVELKYENNDTTENSLIEQIHHFILNNGFTFSSQQIINYYLSLKTKPFVILTGISGTGKTKITELLAKAVCEDDEKQYKCLPVRPDWNDDKYLLGYYNPLTKKYQTTDFLNFIMQADKDHENPYFVCLDEMNLARVEYYFSTFLSAMESKNEISLHSEKTNIQTDNGEEIPGKIKIPPNLFFTGTVNMDETTYRFSPKVLDRANTIEFNEIDLLKARENNNQPSNNQDISNLFKEVFLEGRINEKIKNENNENYSQWEKENWDKLVRFLKEINYILEKNNLHFGYRIRDEILRYVYFAEKLSSSDFTTDTALDFQIKQKLLPRIKGPESIRPALESLRDKLAGGKYPISSAKINQMLEALQNGYTDFYQ